jgi:3-carboxy-cis,cis-muconate cycloisomerase
MARFEGALARASARAGVVPAAEADVIAHVCECARFDSAALARAARRAGTLAIPFVQRLTGEVAALSPQAARYVHFGATSQDVIDTAVVLCAGNAARRIEELSRRSGDAAAQLAQRHARTPTVARTLLQPALPVPFGWKAAVWLSLITRSYTGFRAAASEARVLQLGGAGGTLSAFADRGDAVASALADELALAKPSITWHSARDRFARLGVEAAILAGTAGKIARDVSLLMQPEVGEVSEPAGAGRGGSSSMPHKRNPAGSLLALEAAQRAPGLAATLLAQLAPEHERGLGQWQSQCSLPPPAPSARWPRCSKACWWMRRRCVRTSSARAASCTPRPCRYGSRAPWASRPRMRSRKGCASRPFAKAGACSKWRAPIPRWRSTRRSLRRCSSRRAATAPLLP